jgi:hypothetical protein
LCKSEGQIADQVVLENVENRDSLPGFAIAKLANRDGNRLSLIASEMIDTPFGLLLFGVAAIGSVLLERGAARGVEDGVKGIAGQAADAVLGEGALKLTSMPRANLPV